MFWDADASVEREPVTARSLIAFTMGDMMEQAGVIMARQALGNMIVSPNPETGEQAEFVREVGGATISGHIDMQIMDPVHGVVPVDWKTCTEYTFRDAEAAATDPTHKWWRKNRDGHVAQVQWYIWGTDAQRGYLVYVNKNTGHLCEIEIRRDDAHIEELVRKLIYVTEAIRVNALPGRPKCAAEPVAFSRRKLPSGEMGPGHELDMDATPDLSFWCSYCPFTMTCFPGYSVVAMSKPVYRKGLE